MMDGVDKEYYRKRAEDELTCAQSCVDPDIARIHYEMLGYYLTLLYPDYKMAPGSAGMGTLSLITKADTARAARASPGRIRNVLRSGV
jgi:hypothetical protein